MAEHLNSILMRAAALRYDFPIPSIEVFAARLLVDFFEADDMDGRLDRDDPKTDALAVLVADIDNATAYLKRDGGP